MICLRRKFYSYRNLIISFLLLFAVRAGAEAATRTWTGAWDQTPEAGDHIVIVSGDLTWDAPLPDTVGSWTQEEGYDGTVTFKTVYPDADLGDFTVFTITGDALIDGGTWTHPANDEDEDYRLKVSVGGDLTVGEHGSIDADGRGYAGGRGPGGASAGGSYGGRGGRTGDSGPTYGSVTQPAELGSGGHGARGGGAVILNVVSGTVTELPASHETLSYPEELQRVTLIIKDKGKVGLTADLTVGDLIFEGPD